MILTSLAIQVRVILSWTKASQASGPSILLPDSRTLSSARRQKRRVGREAGKKGKYLQSHFFKGLPSLH